MPRKGPHGSANAGGGLLGTGGTLVIFPGRLGGVVAREEPPLEYGGPT